MAVGGFPSGGFRGGVAFAVPLVFAARPPTAAAGACNVRGCNGRGARRRRGVKVGIASWGARGRCCVLRVGSKELRWWATLLGVCLVGTGPTCAGLPPPAPTSPTADPFRPLHFPCSFSAPKAAPYSGARVCPCWGGGFASWSRAWRGGFSQASRRVVSRHRALREIVFGRCGAAAAAAPDCCPLKVPLLPSPQPSCFPFYLIGVHSTMTPRSPHRRFFRVPIRAIGTGARGSGLPRAFFSLSPCGRAASPPTWHKHPCRRFLLSSAGRT